MSQALSEYFSLSQRYARSINLERDIDEPESIAGYVLTDRALIALKRILVDAPESNRTHAWTITGVYGTGKSAFAQFLSCLCAPQSSLVKSHALEVAKKALGGDNQDYRSLETNLTPRGWFRGIAAAQREPLAHTIVRALDKGAQTYWRKARTKPEVVKKLIDLNVEINAGYQIDSKEVLWVFEEVTRAAKSHILLIIDELGKSLEFASLHQSNEDLYLLQQLAELKQPQGQQFYLLGLLHQSFADYGYRLASIQRNEWAKIQGRFTDIYFTESPRQMTRLIGQAIDKSHVGKYGLTVQKRAKEWYSTLSSEVDDISIELFAATYPLHPITALVLPILCTRYAQNDRSLFTFLGSLEPFSFQNYLNETTVTRDAILTLKLDRIYDYFIEVVGMSLDSRPQLQKWVEIQHLINEAQSLDPDSLKLLKTVGILNLIATTGTLKASRRLVILSMCDFADDDQRQAEVGKILDTLLNQKGQLTYRQQADELRIWEGSDFDIEGEIANLLDHERTPLVNLLSVQMPLKPIVAQRHSYKTGTLRYFERRYVDSQTDWNKIICGKAYDGLICYWIDEKLPENIPAQTADAKPLIVMAATNLNLLQIGANQYAALKKIQTSNPQLPNDGVARLEVRHRLVHAERFLDEAFSSAFDLTAHQNPCWVMGEKVAIANAASLNTELSEVCDGVYHHGMTLWNELINRRELSSQMVKALRTLIQGMLNHGDREGLGLSGNGPEVSIYTSVLGITGIHRAEGGMLGFYPPTSANITAVWEAIENFCLDSRDQTRTLDKLYEMLDAPPYGVKPGVIPILLMAVWLYRMDDVSVYKDGTFIPVLGSEHFELLVKHPQRFAVKYFEIVGLRSQVFRELENVVKSPNANFKSKNTPINLRNATLLSAVKPLFQFVKKLPAFTTKTTRISPEAQAVVKTLQKAQEPDVLLFQSLPIACGLEAIALGQADNDRLAKQFKDKLVQVLKEIQLAYDRQLAECQKFLHDAFGVRGSDETLREDLRVRSSYLSDTCLERTLKRFILAAADDSSEDKTWLEALLMIVADKPAESWSDEDVINFELKLGDLARRFKNLEAIQKDMAATSHVGFKACRVTLTHPDGSEVHRMLWFDRTIEDAADRIVDRILAEDLQSNDLLKQAVIAKLNEKGLADAETKFSKPSSQDINHEGSRRSKKH